MEALCPHSPGLAQKTPQQTDKPTPVRNETGITQRYRCVLCYAPGMPTVRITVDGKPAVTVQQALERYRDRYGIRTVTSMRSIVHRAGLEPAGHADDRTPLYLIKTLDALMDSRPGKGNRR